MNKVELLKAENMKLKLHSILKLLYYLVSTSLKEK